MILETILFEMVFAENGSYKVFFYVLVKKCFYLISSQQTQDPRFIQWGGSVTDVRTLHRSPRNALLSQLSYLCSRITIFMLIVRQFIYR